jgi:hypothetical protein
MKNIDPNIYYIRKKLRKDFHQRMRFDHETVFTKKDLTLKQIRLEFATGTEFIIIKSSDGEFLIKKLPKRWDRKKTQYYDLYLIRESKFEQIEDEVNLGTCMGYIELTNAKIYVRTSGGYSQQNDYSPEPEKECFAEWCQRMLEAGQKHLLTKWREAVQKRIQNFEFEDENDIDIFLDSLRDNLERKNLDISEIVRAEEGDDPPSRYSRYHWQHTLYEWERQLGIDMAKKKFWKACHDYVGNY